MFESTISVDMRNTMKAEAVKCMGILNLDKRCIKAFEKGNVWMSSGPLGGLYEADENLYEVKENSRGGIALAGFSV